MKKFFIISSLLLLTACGGGEVDSTPNQLGSDDAPVQIEVFSDAECPACGAIVPMLEEVVRDNSNIAYLEYYHFPLSYHEYAFLAAEASECAAEQGKFWEYTDTLYENQSSINEDYLYSVADSLNLKRDAFDDCLTGHDKKSKVLMHAREGRMRQIPGTPTIYVNGQQVRFSNAEEFEALIQGMAK
jgi:protein-disulfide isomerase